LIQFKDKFASDEFVLIGLEEEKAFFDDFSECVDKPDIQLLPKLSDVKGIKNKIDTLIQSVKSNIKRVATAANDFKDNVQQEGWITSIGEVIIQEAGFIGQISHMKNCFTQSQSKNATLAARLGQA